MSRGRFVVVVVVCSSLAIAAGCGGSSTQPTAVHSARPTASATAPVVFHGVGYEFTPPAGWFAKPAVGSWRIGVSPLPFVSGFATFSAPAGDPWIVIGRRQVQAGVSLKDWVARLVASHTITYERSTCLPAEHLGRADLSGEPAQVRSFHCPEDGPKGVAAQVLAVHGGHGYVAMCANHHAREGPLAAFEKVCADWLATFAFSG